MQKMWQRFFSFLVVCLLMFYGEIFSQKIPHKGMSFPGIMSIPKTLKTFTSQLGTFVFLKYEDCTGFTRHQLLNLPTPDFYNNHLGIICKKEWQLEKITLVPFRFRLGSLEYVNYLEQKPNARKPGL